MRKKRYLPLLTALMAALLLSGCKFKLPELKGVDPDKLFHRDEETETAAPAAEPTPEPTPRPVGAHGKVLDFFEALADDDRTAVRFICPDIPGYLTAEPPEEPVLRKLYRTAYQNLEWRVVNVSEGNASASVTAEITAPDLRRVMEQLSGELSTVTEAGRERIASERLSILLDSAAEETLTRRVTISLSRSEGEWVIDASPELLNALTGSLIQTLVDFDLPERRGADVPLSDEDRETRQCLMDNYLSSLVVTAIRPNDPEGYVLEADAVNKSGSAIILAVRSAVINGFLMDPEWYVELNGGETKHVRIVWSREAMAERGIGSIHYISMVTDSFQKPAWPVYPAASNSCTLCPNGASSERDPLPTRPDQRALLDSYAGAVALLSTESEGCWGCTLTLAIENRSDEELWFAMGEPYLNGMELDPLWSQTLPPHTCSVEHVRFRAGALIMRDISEASSLDTMIYVSTLAGLDPKEGAISLSNHVIVSLP